MEETGADMEEIPSWDEVEAARMEVCARDFLWKGGVDPGRRGLVQARPGHDRDDGMRVWLTQVNEQLCILYPELRGQWEAMQETREEQEATWGAVDRVIREINGVKVRTACGREIETLK